MIKKEFLIGRYQLGWRMVNLYADPLGAGAWFNLCRNQQDAQIHVGMDYNNVEHPFANLCHEVYEMSADDAGCLFKPKAFEEGASDLVRFFMDHNEFTEVSSKASYFIWQCAEDFKKAFKKCNCKIQPGNSGPK